MRLVHLSDLHLGYRAYPRTTPAGINQREADVAASFRAAITQIVALAPDLVVIGGDVFDAVRPPNAAIVATFGEFARLVSALPRTIVVMVAGNHDAVKTSDRGGILQLFANLGVHVVDRSVERLEFPDRELSVLAVPDARGVKRPPLVPNAGARFNVLLMHGEVTGMLAAGARKGERPAVEIPPEEIGPDRWDYVALGHYHVYRELAPNMFYSGAIDYTSSSIWGELAEQQKEGVPGKGFIEHDLVSGAHMFHQLPPSRVVADLGTIDATGLEPSQVDDAIRAAVEGCPGGIENAVARLLIHGVTSQTVHALDQRALRKHKARALNFKLDVRHPDVVRLGSIIGPALMRDKDKPLGKGWSLEKIVENGLAKREVAPGINRDELAARAAQYLADARQKTPSESISVLEAVG